MFFYFCHYIDCIVKIKLKIMRTRKKNTLMNILKMAGLVLLGVIFRKNIMELLNKVPVVGDTVVKAVNQQENNA